VLGDITAARPAKTGMVKRPKSVAAFGEPRSESINTRPLFPANLSSALGSCRSPWHLCRDRRCGVSPAQTLPVEPVQSMHAKPSSGLRMRGALRIRSTGSSPSRNVYPCFLNFHPRESGVGSGITPCESLRLQGRKVCVVSL
jgi:hypothetical protein